VGAREPAVCATDRVYADSGHSLDFINKACECLDQIGWEHAGAVLPSVVGQMVAARGADETTAWRHPVDLVVLCEETAAELRALKAAVLAGASPADLGRSLAYAAALRVVRFGTASEHADWKTALHVFTFANAIHQGLKRIEADESEQNGGIDPTRGVLHGAIAVYLARYLNVPPARLPGDNGDPLDDIPDSIEAIHLALLGASDRQRQVDAAGRLVARHLTLGHPPSALIATLAQGLLRQDAGLHAYQMLEAGVRQFREWGNTGPGRHILIAVARYLAAHSPTSGRHFRPPTLRSGCYGGELHQDT
jgi:hypothetical protein